MTVAIGLVCADGVLVASDSMASSEFRTAQVATKVFASDALPLAWTAAGSVYVIEEVAALVQSLETEHQPQADAVRVAVQNGDRTIIRNGLGQSVANRIKNCYANALPFGLNQQVNGSHPFISDFLLVGWANDQPWFLEVARDGQMNWHEAALFSAVGSGGAFASVAHGLMAHYLEGELLPLELATQLAYRTIETTCEVSTGGVGLPVQLAVVNGDGARVLTEEEVEEVKTAVSGWKLLERETLTNPVADQAEPEPLPTLDDDGN